MNAQQLVEFLNQNAVEWQIIDGNLRFRAPRGVLSDDLREQLKQNKDEVIRILEQLSPGRSEDSCAPPRGADAVLRGRGPTDHQLSPGRSEDSCVPPRGADAVLRDRGPTDHQLSPGRSEDSCVPPRGADAVLRGRGPRFRDSRAIVRRSSTDGWAPTSFAQQRLWFLDQLDRSASVAYHIAAGLRLHGELNRTALRAALDRLVARHEALRTTLLAGTNEPCQVIAPPECGFALLETDLCPLDPSEREAELARIGQAEASAPFDLAAGPLIRGRLLQLSANEHVLLVTQHHAISDGWSMGVLVYELGALYSAFSCGRPDPLPALQIQYADYAAWQRQWLRGEVLQRQLHFWREQLANAPALLELPSARPRPAVQSYRGDRVGLDLGARLSASLRGLAQRHGVTLFMVLLGAWSVLLSRLAGQSDLVLGTPVANRGRAEIERLIGLFVNTLALRITLHEDPSVAALLQQIKARTLAAYANQDVPFEQVVEALRPARSLSHSPVFQVMLALDNTPGRAALDLPGLRLTPLDAPRATTQFDLSLSLVDEQGSIGGYLEYASDLFEHASIERWAGHLRTVLEGMVANDQQRISRLPLLSDDEREQLLYSFNASAAEFAGPQLIHQLFEAQAAMRPDAIAVVHDDQRLSYHELNRRSNRIAHRLLALGVRPDDRVALCAQRSPEMLVGLLAILKAGAAYVPLDPAYPALRLAYMLDDCAPLALLTQTRLRDTPIIDNAAASDIPTLLIDESHNDRDSDLPDHNPDPREIGLRPDHLAYLIYTSGSTGMPKGVMVEHRSVVNLIQAHIETCGLGPQDRVLQFASFAFDTSAAEIFPALSAGASIVLRPGDLRVPDTRFARFVHVNRITVADLPTAFWHQWCEQLKHRDDDLSTLRLVIAGGEKAQLPFLKDWFSDPRSNVCRWLNAYGPTETTVHTATISFDSNSPLPEHDIPIGGPIANTQIYVLDAYRQPVPIGVSGEIYIGGAGVARGYWNRAELTAQRFIADSFGSNSGARLYRTGDLGRWSSDGTIEYLGRNDFQVKVHGYRIEPGEIETKLLQCPGVHEAAVVVREDAAGDKRLVAYLLTREGAGHSVAEIRAALAGMLPEPMIPSAFVRLDSLPLQPNGKVDRLALPAPDSSSVITRDYENPAGEVEIVLARIWQDLLGVDRVGRHDHFFELGGHSLLALQVSSRLRQALGVEVALSELFAQPTLLAFARVVDQAARGELPPVIRAERNQDPLPLSFAQQRLWFLDQLDRSASVAYHIAAGLRLHGELNRSALRAALDRLVARHEALRTTLLAGTNEPCQLIAPPECGFALIETDLSSLDPSEREAELARISQAEASAPFDLAAGPLIRGRLLQLSANEHVLLVTQHHVISDGWSIGVLVYELGALYSAFSCGRPDPLPALQIQYADYAAWQRQWLRGEVLQRQLDFWREQLANAPALLELPSARPRPAVQSYRGDRVCLDLGARLSASLRGLAQRHGVTLFMVLLGAWSVLLSRLAGQSDLVLGTPVANRGRAEIERLIGLFVNTLALRITLHEDPSVAALLQQIKARTLAAYANQDVPFEQVVEALRPARSLSHSPVFQVMLALDNTPGRAALDLPGLRLTPLDAPRATTQFDLSLSLVDEQGSIGGYLEYASDLFEHATIERWAGHLRTVLEGMVANDQQRISRLPLLSDDEREQLLYSFNASAAEFAGPQLIHQLFEAQAATRPDAVAVVYDDQRLSYHELNRRANRIAHRLLALGVRPDDRVALCAQRSPEMLVALLAILKAGAAYVPLDPAYPAQRLAYMLDDCAPLALLTQTRLRDIPIIDNAAASNIPTLLIDESQSDRDSDLPDHNPDPREIGLRPDHLAYVIYTSGSTGMPKGVMNQHDGVINRLLWGLSEHKLTEADRVLQKTPFTFDVSVWEFFLPLLAGARLVLARPGGHQDPGYLKQLIGNAGITMLHFVPSMLQAFLDDPGTTSFPTLRRVLCSGEALPYSMQQRFERLLPGVELHNLYGPTEAAIEVTSWRCDPALHIGKVPIGRPIANIQIHILDRHQQPVPIGAAGEIHIGGIGVARGYLNRPELSAERFIADPFSTRDGARLYKTGDLGRRLADGVIEYLGRNDFQVKIRGVRIELGEVEAALRVCSGVREAAVDAREDTPGAKRLVAYLVGDRGVELCIADLRSELATVLPEHMIPSAFVSLDALPLTPSGKLDRNALPAPTQSAVITRSTEAPVGPIENAIALIWQDLLGLEQVGRHDHFFELGGHSLMIVSLVERLREQGLVADVRSIFAAPQLSMLASAIAENAPELVEDVPPNLITAGCEIIVPELLPLVRLTQNEIHSIADQVPGGAGNIQDIYPLSPLQEGILFHHLLASEGDAYLLRWVLAFTDRQRLDVFLDALQRVIDRHDILRSAIAWAGLSDPVQVVHRRALLPITELEAGAGNALDQLLAQSDPQRFRLDLTRAPLLHATVIHDRSSGEWLLAAVNHHIACDHVSMELILAEVRSLLSGQGDKLPAPMPYRNYIARTRRVSNAEHEAYFRAQLRDVDEPTAPFGLIDVQGDGRNIEEARRPIGDDLARSIRDHARVLGVNVAVLFHVAWAQVLGRCSARDDVVFGTVVSGRLQGSAGADRVLGMFINTLPIRIALLDRNVRDVVGDTYRTLGELLVHEHASLALAQRCSALPPTLPLFTSLLNYRHSRADITREKAAATQAWDGVRLLCGDERTNYPLMLSVDDSGDGFALTAQCAGGIDPNLIVQYVDTALHGLVDALAQGGLQALSEVEILPESVRRTLRVDFNSTAVDHPKHFVHQLVERHADSRPDAIAIVHGKRSASYRELNRRANRLAHDLIQHGVRPDDRIALCIDRSVEMIVGLLAILKAGAAAVPLDPAYPAERLAYMLADSAPVAVLTNSALRDRIVGLNPGLASIALRLLDSADHGSSELAAHPDCNPDPLASGLTPDHLAYVIYTSGSTGTPKGVAMPQRALTNLIQWQLRTDLHTSTGDKTLQFAALGFDVAFQEIFSTLCSGECLVLIDEALRQDPAALVGFVHEQQIGKLYLPFIALQNFAEAARRSNADLTALKHVITAGEQLRISDAIRALFERSPGCRLHNHYGPTETHVVTSHRLAQDPSNWPLLPPIGAPVANTQIHLLDPKRQPVPPGVIGEIHIGGDCVARGYLNRPELSAERFIADPFSADPDARLYRTGDLGRWLPDGTIEFVGRNDHQLKLRGFRVEPGEIETRLTACPGVREALVLVREDVPGDKRLVAYLTTQDEVELSVVGLRTELAAMLPDYMLPSAFITLDDFPLTPNGKLDRIALPAPDRSSVAAREYEAPAGVTEIAVARIWQDLLGVEQVGRRDNFFELGGHSLLVIGLIERLRLQGLDASVRSVFAAPTLCEFASRLLQSSGDAVAVPPNPIGADCTQITPALLPLVTLTQDQIDAIVACVPGGAANIQDIYPLSPLQEGIYFHHLLGAEGDSYVLRWVLAFDSSERLAAFLAALQSVVDRHDILRSAICSNALPQPVQVVHRRAPLRVETLQAADRDALDQLLAMTESRAAPLDLTQAPLLSASWLHDRNAGEWLLALRCHHMVVDHYTIDLMLDEVRALLQGRGETLAPPLPYRNFIAQARAVPLSEHEAYFRRELGDVDQPSAPFDRLYAHGEGLRIDEARVHLAQDLVERIDASARQAGVSAAVLFHVAWAQVLAKCTGRDDVVFGTVLSGRLQGSAGADRVLGMFINTLPIRIVLRDNGASVVVADTYRRLSELLAYEQAPLALAQRCSGVAAPAPLFTSLLNYRHDHADAESDWQGMRLLRGEDRTNYPITVSVNDRAEGYTLIVQCVAGIDAQRVSGYLATAVAGLVDALAQQPDAAVCTLPIVPPEERVLLLGGFAQPDAGAAPAEAPALIHALFERQAAAHPDSPAVVFEGSTLSYAELNRRANQLAHRLIALGVLPDERVALCLERSCELIVAVLAVLKAGAAYVPLDPAYPPERLAYMLTDSAPVALITQTSLRAICPASAELPLLLLDDAETFRALGSGPEHDPQVAVTPQHLAYVIYTSGSTGQPKGVMVEHAHVTRLFAATREQFNFDASDVWTLFHSFAFDFSVWEIWGALLHGARLVVVPALCARSPEQFHALLCRERVTVLNQTPSAFRALIDADARSSQAHALRCIVFGGEALELQMLAPWIARNDPQRTRLVNMYGITEITVHATYREISAADVAARLGSVIGRALPDLRLLILDRKMQPVPPGVAGEMYVGGAGVARGYLNRPALSAERFLADPFGAPGARLYKTGDLARWLPDGTIEFLGRNDLQVKIRGFRIEPAEIEAALLSCHGVRDALVVAREDTPGDKRLVAYLVGAEEQELAVAALRTELALKLPAHMLPGAFVQLASFPLTPNGKLDRRALPAPDQAAFGQRAYQAPQGPVESTLARLWQELLGLQQVGRDDHFFELGGHSLLVVSLIERLRQHELRVDVRSIFAAPTLAALAARLESAGPAVSAVPPNLITPACREITPELLPLLSLTQGEIDSIVAGVPGGVANVQDIYPLAPLQEGILFHHLLQREGDAYLLRSVLQFDSRARLDSFVAALQHVIDRHDILRSAVHWQGLAQAVQVVQRQAPLPLVQLAPAEDALGQLLQHTDPRRVRLDLRRAPLLAASVIEGSDGAWLMALLSHHMVDDNYTLQLMLAEVRAVLDGRARSLAPALPYRNFIAQLRTLPQAEHEAYFRAQLGDVHEPTLPFGVLEVPPDAPIQEATLALDATLAARIRSCARTHGISAAVLFHAAWARVLAACSARDDVVFGTTVSGRLQGSAGADRVLGLFINTLPMRLVLAGCSVTQWLAQTQTRLAELLAHEQASLALAQRCSAVAAPLPLFTALLNYRHTQLLGAQHHEHWPGVQLLRSEERTNYPLTMSINDLGQGFELNAQCVPGIDAQRVARYLATAIDALVHALANDPQQPAHTLAVLPEAERRQLLVQFNATAVPYPQDRLIHQLVEQQAAARPEASAVVFGEQTLSYRELNQRANRLAHRLLALGVRPDQRIAVCMQRSVQMVVALLGVLKAGAAYVPLDPQYPAERIAYMLQDCAPAALLTNAELKSALPAADVPVLTLDDPETQHALAQLPSHNIDPRTIGLTSNHLAYVLYTSGSTGVPKGVAMPQAGLLNLIHWHRSAGLDEKTLQFAALGFDVAFQEIFSTLCSGACLVLVDEATRQDPSVLLGFVKAQRIQRLFLPYIALQNFAEAAERSGEELPHLKTIISAGEQLRIGPAIRSLFERAPWRSLHNHYGPTETHVVTAHTLAGAPGGWPALPPIGRPIANSRIHILDGRGQAAPIGVAGEIHIGGAGLARGYLNRPELSAERFIADRFEPNAGSRLYKTGDIGRWLADGTIEYLGRNDFQVKVRGVRVELGEIENRLASCSGVREAVVIAREDVPGDKRLVAYLLPQSDAELSVAVLRAELALVLPEYMLPAAFVPMLAFPLTPNGKLDRNALPAPDRSSLMQREYQAPRGPVELAIAAIWQELLGIERVGSDDHFFELGGHSLLAVQVTVRLRERCGIDLALRSVFEHPVLHQLAEAAIATQLALFAAEDIDELEHELESLSESELLSSLSEVTDHA